MPRRADTSEKLYFTPARSTSRVPSGRRLMPWKRSSSTIAASRSSLSTRAPPSMVVMFLLGWKLNDTMSPVPHRAARGARSDREGRILEDADLVAFGESLERVRIERCVVMRRKQQARLRRDRGLRLRKIDVARAEVHVDEHGARAGAFDHVAGHEEALRSEER